MARSRTVFVCSGCGADTPRWQGKCPACGAWNTLSALTAPAVRRGTRRAAAAGAEAVPLSLASVAAAGEERLGTGLGEFDRVLGGGLVAGSVTLIGGDPGIGKSTLLLQCAAALAARTPVL
mgnify:FL=1